MSGFRAVAVTAALALGAAGAASAWDRGDVETFAVMPEIAPGVNANIEGLTVGPDGRVYTPSFGFNNKGGLSGNAHLFVFHSDGRLCANATIQGSSPHPLGLEFNPVTGQLIVLDFGAGTVLGVEAPACGATSVASTLLATAPAGAGLNALTFDKAGNAYISDSFLGVIWKMPPHGGTLTAWSKPTDPWLLGNGVIGNEQPLTPPFGANGVEFNNAGTILFVANTAYHQMIQIPVNPDGSAGTASVFVTGINAPDGIRIDKHDNIWICANQQDEIDVVDKTGKVIAKLGDFNGVSEDGLAKGFLFPASPAFSKDGKSLLVANLALYLPFAGAEHIAIDSGWTLDVSRYSISRIPAVIPGQKDDD